MFFADMACAQLMVTRSGSSWDLVDEVHASKRRIMKPSADSQHCEVARWRLKTTITTLEAKLLSCDQARHSLPCTRNHASADPCWEQFRHCKQRWMEWHRPVTVILRVGVLYLRCSHAVLQCQVQWNQLSDSVGVVQNKAKGKRNSGVMGLHVSHFSQVCNIERGVWEGMDCVQVACLG